MYNPISKFFDYLRYREAVRKADEAHAKTGERYYVMPTEDRKKLLVIDRANFRKMRHKGYINKQAVVRDLISEAFYFTPYRNGNGYLNEEGRKFKLKLYFSYCEAKRELKHGKANTKQ